MVEVYKKGEEMLRAEKGSINQEKRRRLERKLKLESSKNSEVAGIKEKIKAIQAGIKELKTDKVKKATTKVAKEVLSLIHI